MSASFISAAAKATQCHALLEALKRAPVSTIEAREGLGIVSPPARCYDLRRQGWSIETGRGTVLDAAGRNHTVAIYRLTESAKGLPHA